MYDKLDSSLQARRLRRCHPDFRVVALGLPVPPYKGRTLDPPLRSRFQCRVVEPELTGADCFSPPFTSTFFPWSPPPSLSPSLPPSPPPTNPQIALFVETLRQVRLNGGREGGGEGGRSGSFPIFPTWILPHTHHLLKAFPGCGQGQALARLYPFLYQQQQQPEQQKGKEKKNSNSSSSSSDSYSGSSSLVGLARKLGVNNLSVGPVFQSVQPLLSPSPPTAAAVGAIAAAAAAAATTTAAAAERQVRLVFEGGIEVTAQGGEHHPSNDPLPLYASSDGAGGGGREGGYFVETPTTLATLTAMLQEHSLGRDVCLLGGKGVGKSRLAELFCHRLGYRPEIFPMFKDMTPRDLVQRRGTDERGNTRWEDSPLLKAAREGGVVVLDGVHRLHPDTLSTLQRVCVDREMELMDGSRLVKGGGGREGERGEGGRGGGGREGGLEGGCPRVLPLHPSFRIIALGEAEVPKSPSSLPVSSSSSFSSPAPWLHQDILPLFSWLVLPSLSSVEHDLVLLRSFPSLPPSLRRTLLEIEAGLSNKEEEGEDLSLSTRQLMRLARSLAVVKEGGREGGREALPGLVHDALMTAFATGQVRDVVEDVLRKVELWWI